MFARFFVVLASTLLLALASPALATGPPVVETDSFSFTDVDPCTGETMLVTFDMTITIHEFELTDPPRHHLTAREDAVITTSSGFVGRGTRMAVDNGAGLFGEEEGQGMFTFVLNDVLRKENGQMMRVHLTTHVTVVGGEIVTLVDKFRFECVKGGVV
jgi:hypothetical protein